MRTTGGDTHILAVKISPYMPYFGSEELRKLDQLSSMVGLAIERCEMAEQVAFAGLARQPHRPGQPDACSWSAWKRRSAMWAGAARRWR